MGNMIRVHADLEWQINQSKSLPVWVGVCDALNLTVQSDSWRELAEDISETLDTIFLDLNTEDELSEFLQKNGWELEDEIPSQVPRGSIRSATFLSRRQSCWLRKQSRASAGKWGTG